MWNKFRELLLPFILVLILINTGCSKYEDIAKLDAGQGRSVYILAQRHYENNQAILYRVEVNGQVVVPDTYISSVNPGEAAGLRFKLLKSNNGAVIGIIEETVPQNIWVLHNFVTGETWPRCDGGGLENCRKRAEGLLRELQKDHPDVAFKL